MLNKGMLTSARFVTNGVCRAIKYRHFSSESLEWFDVKKESIFNFLSHKSITNAVIKNVVYKNDHIMVINKPSYLQVFTPPDSSFPSIETVADKLKIKLKSDQLFVSTRLSSLYSGLVVFSFSTDADQFIKSILKDRKKRGFLFSDVAITVGGCLKTPNGSIKGKDIAKVFDNFIDTTKAQTKFAHGKISYSTIKCNQENGTSLMQLNPDGGLLEQGLLSMASILNPVLGDHVYSQMLGYLHNIPFILPENAKISEDRAQILPFNVRKALLLPKTVTKNELHLHAHRHKLTLPKSELLGLAEDTTFIAPLPHHFSLTLEILNLYDEDVKPYFCYVL